MSFISEIADIFGIRSTPWVIRVYVVLLFVCVGLIVLAATSLPGAPDNPGVQSKLLELGIDSFKIVLGAVIGALSMAASHQWGGKEEGVSGKDNAGDEA